MENDKKKIEEWITDSFPDEEILLADGFEDAFMGIAYQFRTAIAVFDYNKCLDILKRDGMDDISAQEYMDFNVTGAWMGSNTPAYFFRFVKEDESSSKKNQKKLKGF